VLELLGIDENTILEITTDGQILHITPESRPSEREALFDKAQEFVFDNYDDALAELAK
jgi:hypothetical protein